MVNAWLTAVPSSGLIGWSESKNQSASAVQAGGEVPALAANTPMLLRAGLVEGNTDAGVLASGQVAGIIDDLPTVAELIERIVAEAEPRLDHLATLRA